LKNLRNIVALLVKYLKINNLQRNDKINFRRVLKIFVTDKKFPSRFLFFKKLFIYLRSSSTTCLKILCINTALGMRGVVATIFEGFFI